jgi:hypothetical protein
MDGFHIGEGGQHHLHLRSDHVTFKWSNRPTFYTDTIQKKR